MSKLKLVRTEPEVIYIRSFKEKTMKLEELRETVSEDDFSDITFCQKCNLDLPEHRLAYLADGTRVCANCLFEDRPEGGHERS
jgi:hypothetical protein